MADYKEMYAVLFRAVTNAVNVLQQAQPHRQPRHPYVKSLPICQRYQCRVAFPYTHGAPDLFGDDHAAEIVDPSDYSCRFQWIPSYLPNWISSIGCARICLSMQKMSAEEIRGFCL